MSRAIMTPIETLIERAPHAPEHLSQRTDARCAFANGADRCQQISRVNFTSDAANCSST